MFIGLMIFRTKKYVKYLPLLFLALGGLIPAIVTVDAPHATRSLLFMWMLPMFAAIAANYSEKLTKMVAMIALIEVVIFASIYFGSFPESMPSSWPTGIRQALEEVDGDKVVITNAKGMTEDIQAEQVYIYILLYDHIDPKVYVDTVEMNPPDIAGMIRVAGFDGYGIINEPENAMEDSVIVERNKQGFYAAKK
jgi:hypothetical protein